MSAKKTLSRREWLRKGAFWSLAGTALAALAWIFLDVWLAASRFSGARWTEVAPAGTLAADGTVPFPKQRVAFIRRGQRVAAISLECTHLGCLINAVDQGFFCPCHGSEFGPTGEVYSGPAKKPLWWHAIQIKGGRLWVHTGRKLSRPHWVDLDPDSVSEQQGKA